MTTITLRPATVNDFDYLFALHRDTLGPYVDQVWGWNDDEQRAYLQLHAALPYLANLIT